MLPSREGAFPEKPSLGLKPGPSVWQTGKVFPLALNNQSYSWLQELFLLLYLDSDYSEEPP